VTGPAVLATVAALERLDTALDSREFATTLVTGDGRRACLTVASRTTPAAENLYADGARYWWAWGQPICTVEDPLTAAHQVTAMLRATPGGWR
jgi:hypothetical protein